MAKPMTENISLSRQIDQGHTRLCNRCGAGHGINPFMRGRERTLEIAVCKPCLDKPQESYEKRYSRGLVG